MTAEEKLNKVLSFCKFKKNILAECNNEDDTALVLMEYIVEMIEEG